MNELLKKRTKKNISIKELSKMTGISERYLYFIEKGQRIPSIKTAKKISNALDTSIDEIF